jgi:hypothetical protein
MIRSSNSLYGNSFIHLSCHKKKAPFFTGLVLLLFYNYLQQSLTSLEKEVKIETVPEIIICHFAIKLKLR